MMTAAIIQARMSSTRLPGKVMKPLCGKPMLWHIITRLGHAKQLDKVIIATTDREEDKVIAKLAEEMGAAFYCGSLDDVLDRYYQAAKKFNAETIVRITADCPMIDPETVDSITDHFLKHDYDYVSNTIKPTMPDGLDTEVFSFKSLEKAWEEARKPSEREHVTPYIYNHPEMFKISNYEYDVDLSGMRWVVDQEEDYKFVSEVYTSLYRDGKIFDMQSVIRLLKENPGLLEINKGIARNEGYQISILKDEKDTST
ncbi:MAG: glycosyltransferase family protein [Thermodesulfovibrionia bacterium]|nr:glycosyltransferase family protein [Thermodesulfovibrionia bacterium]